MLFLELFYTFLLIGIFTFGGGYSMVALIQDEVVAHHGWMTAQEFTDMLAISQMTPGPIGINTATFAGYTAAVNAGYPTLAAIAASLTASLAVILLPVALMVVVCRYLQRHIQNPHVQTVMHLLRLAVVGLIAAAALQLLTADTFGSPGPNTHFLASLAIFATVFALSYFKIQNTKFKILNSPILLILLSGTVGFLLYR